MINLLKLKIRNLLVASKTKSQSISQSNQEFLRFLYQSKVLFNTDRAYSRK